jgi:periodic tryptophan protein 2
MYEVSQRILIKRFMTTYNRSLDGVLDKLISKDITEAGVSHAFIEDDDDEKFNNFESLKTQKKYLPGVQYGDFSSRKSIPKAIRTKHVVFSPTGDNWAAATTEGMMIFSLDAEATFDPVNLGMDITPENIELTFTDGEYAKALLMSLRLNEKIYIHNVLKHCPPDEISLIVRSIPTVFLQKLIEVVAELIESSQSIEYLMMWCQNLLSIHGAYLKKNVSQSGAALGLMQKCLQKHYQLFSEMSDSNKFNLKMLAESLRRKKATEAKENEEEEDLTAKITDRKVIQALKKQKVEIEV